MTTDTDDQMRALVHWALGKWGRHLRDNEDREDIKQDLRLAVWQARQRDDASKGHDPMALTWVMLRQVFIQHYRHRRQLKRRLPPGVRFEDDFDGLESIPAPAVDLDAVLDAKDIVNQALNRATPAQARVIRRALTNGGETSAAVRPRRMRPAFVDPAQAYADFFGVTVPQLRIVIDQLPDDRQKEIARMKLAGASASAIGARLDVKVESARTYLWDIAKTIRRRLTRPAEG